MAINFPYWDLHEVSVLLAADMGNHLPHKEPFWGEFPCARTPTSRSPSPRGQCREQHRQIPLSERALSFQQLGTAQGTAWTSRCHPELPQLQTGQVCHCFGSLSKYVFIMKARGTSSESLGLLCGRGRGGLWRSCAGDFPTLEKVCPGYPPWGQQATCGVPKHLWGNELSWHMLVAGDAWSSPTKRVFFLTQSSPTS